MSQPTLETSRLELVPLDHSPEHKQLIFDLDADPEVMRFIAFGRPFTPDESTLVRGHLLKAAEQPGFGCWVARTKPSTPASRPELIGWWVLCPSETDARRAEFGLRVVRSFWGRGFAKEGTAALLRHAFEDPRLGGRLDEVFGETMTVNSGSRRTMESCGMRLVRTFFNEYKDFTPAPGIEHGEVEYALGRDEWVAAGGRKPRRDEDAVSCTTAGAPGASVEKISREEERGVEIRKWVVSALRRICRVVGGKARVASHKLVLVGPSILPSYNLGRAAMRGGGEPALSRRRRRK